ncbi:hypothetical protein NDU88_000969 [Pleurodeles waltl]|uniref:Uncharacterized protein n=1 Tax=Pleurodeles waltl TaxID=8319 RepID=A0AAV7WKZ4_PLEWA|nr:hypothetical protein NDU88_000969 [Pleurodeles waltl]
MRPDWTAVATARDPCYAEVSTERGVGEARIKGISVARHWSGLLPGAPVAYRGGERHCSGPGPRLGPNPTSGRRCGAGGPQESGNHPDKLELIH